MPKRVVAKLGEREYPITEKVSGVAERWRKTLRESSVFVALQSLEGMVDLVVEVFNTTKKVDMNSAAGLIRVFPAILVSLGQSMDDINALLFDYVPEMNDDREWIMANVYDSELVAAFIEVLKLNFPILGVLELVRGFKASGTYTNSPSVNGTIGMPRPRAKSKTR